MRSYATTLALCLCSVTLPAFAEAGVTDQNTRAGIHHPNNGSNHENGNGQGTGSGQTNGNGQAKGNGGSRGTSANGIAYHGGPVMLGTTNVYYIWYGNWSGNNAPTILGNLINGLNGSPYYNINTTYTNGSGTTVTNSVMLSTQTSDNYSQGTLLSDAGVFNVVSSAISSNLLPNDAKGVYFVLTSQDVNETSGFCTKYCGWHTYGTVSGTTIKYAFVGNPARCMSACSAQSTSPNGNPGADAMASIVAHELEESVTDPQLNAWYDSSGQENADKCAWTFGTTSVASNGSKYNMMFNGLQYLIQRNWVNASGGYCAVSYP